MRRGGVEEAFKLTAAFTNGKALHAVRYSSDGEPPTLYTRALPDGSGMLVVSEPLDGGREGWEPVPPQHRIVATARGVERHAIGLSTVTAVPV